MRVDISEGKKKGKYLTITTIELQKDVLEENVPFIEILSGFPRLNGQPLKLSSLNHQNSKPTTALQNIFFFDIKMITFKCLLI